MFIKAATKVAGDVVTYCFLLEIRNISVRETGSRINRHHAPMENVFNVKYLDKMLSYRRETALQGAL